MTPTPQTIIIGHQHKYEMNPRRRPRKSWDIRVGSYMHIAEPIAYERIGDESSIKCVTWTCDNRTYQGRFVGDLCAPCEEKRRAAEAFRDALRRHQ